jgi:DNA repair ATPase RecN
MSNLNQLELSVENLNNSASKLKDILEDYSKLEHIAEKYDRQAEQLKNLSKSFKESARIARLRN